MQIPTFEPPQQTVSLEELRGDRLILDVGAGGEGIVARLGRSRVCAVDIRMDEIREARIHDPPSQWLVADGRDLCFADNTFDMVTFWFSLGYFRTAENKTRAIREAYRVLQNGGILSIKAAQITCEEERFIFRVLYTFPDGTLSSVGYGVRGNQEQTMKSMRELIEDTGFECKSCKDHGHWFEIIAVK
ncbi:MAG: class I SAM-dependent methyltransferase [Candidatus Thorarchaeota archaeon]|nr:class I SAM-dependent methyltransferase [Candidatus Thorarchaeota archaeon]